MENSTLSARANMTDGCEKYYCWNKPKHMYADDNNSYGVAGVGLISFIVLVVVIWVILYAINPESLQKEDKHGYKTGERDFGKTLGAAIILAVIIAIIMAIFYAIFC